ncbi:hypothetical protein DPMN_005720 [Dreissena polymorpha]|uniref:Uncharacterized protein n=1 Tax=Dreissena polymorpha TaxID=45954 RepID=A0A9D4MQS7_DREPO|nr:hypothetical protein DPMN_005720 [Dreissena polymorpha]
MVLLFILFIGLERYFPANFLFSAVASLKQSDNCRLPELFALEGGIKFALASACPQSSSYCPCGIFGSTGDHRATAVEGLEGQGSELCWRTVKDAQGQPRHKYNLYPEPIRLSPDPTWQLYGPCRMVLSSRIVTDQHGSFKLPKTAVLASRSAKDIPGRHRTSTGRHVAKRRLHGAHAVSSWISIVSIRHLYGTGALVTPMFSDITTKLFHKV